MCALLSNCAFLFCSRKQRMLKEKKQLHFQTLTMRLLHDLCNYIQLQKYNLAQMTEVHHKYRNILLLFLFFIC